MVWCVISTLIGALVFGAGISFERLVSAERKEPEPMSKMSESKPAEAEEDALFGQWKNLLEYDGTKQEVAENENR